MIRGEPEKVTQLLHKWSGGDSKALDDLIPIVYAELRRMAKRSLNRERGSHTMQTTELIHEAYLKLAGNQEKNWKNRAHFFGVAAQAMRHILVDYARSKSRVKRGGNLRRITFIENVFDSESRSDEVVALDDALTSLAELDPRKCRVVEMKFFGGLMIDEIAEVLQVSEVTVKRDWSFARNWLLRKMTRN